MNDNTYPTLTIESSFEAGGYQGFTTVLVTGPAEHVETYCVDYLNRWHPMGYGTTCREDREMHNVPPEGHVTYRIWRSNSCD